MAGNYDGKVVYGIVADTSGIDKSVKQVTKTIESESKKWESAGQEGTGGIEKAFSKRENKKGRYGMKQKKKALLGLILVISALLLCAGCNSDKADAPVENTTGTIETTAPTKIETTQPTAGQTQPAETQPTVAPTEPEVTWPVVTPTQPAVTRPTVAPTQPVQTQPTVTPTEPTETRPTVAPTEPEETQPTAGTTPTQPETTQPEVETTQPQESEPDNYIPDEDECPGMPV